MKKTSKKIKEYFVPDEHPSALSIVEDAAAGLYSRPAYNQMLNYIDKNRMAELLHMSYKTLERYTKSNKKLNPLESEMVIKLKMLYKKGEETFGNLKAFNSWLAKPAYGLNWKIPQEIIITPGGIDLVQNELLSIDFGDFS